MSWLRSALYNLFFFGSTTVLCLYGLVAARRSPRRALALGRLWARLNIGAARLLCGIRYEVHGREHLPQSGPMLIASRHQSAYDTMIWLLLLPRAAYVLKAELLQVPLFGPLAAQAGMIPVDRSGAGVALRALMRRVRAATLDGRQVVIFPEGTRAAPGCFPPLQPGIVALAALTKLPVIPVRTDSGACWGRRSFAKRPGTIHIEITPPLAPNLDRATLLGALEKAFQPQGAWGPPSPAGPGQSPGLIP